MKSKCPTSGKRIFLTEETAKFFLETMNNYRAKDKGFKTLRTAYRCKYCGWWHTSKKGIK